MKNYPRLASFVLRVGISVVFVYAAASSFLEPLSWVGYFPQWLHSLIPGTVLLPLFSIYQLALGAWLISGKKIFYSALLAAFTLFGIIIANFYSLEILFRDIAIMFAALALAVLSKGEIHR